MKIAPTVSIIMPAYNAERYLAETLESVQAQTFADLEVLVVDDGSPDGTAEVAQRFADNDSRIRLIRQRNQRVSVARNTAMAAATGRFFALLDSDDLWKPAYLAEQLRVLDEYPEVDIVSANAVNLGGPLDGTLWKAERQGVHPISLLTLISVEASVSIFSVLRRRLFDCVGWFDPAISGNEDYDYWLRAAAQGFRILFNAEPLAYRRKTEGSLSADPAKMLLGIQQPLRKVRALLQDNSAEALAVDRQLARFERERLFTHAKRAIIARDFTTARDHFRSLHMHSGAPRHRAMAFAAARMPSLLVWAYSLKQTVRRFRATGFHTHASDGRRL